MSKKVLKDLKELNKLSNKLPDGTFMKSFIKKFIKNYKYYYFLQEKSNKTKKELLKIIRG